MNDPGGLAIAGLAAVAGGAVNALAGGGTLITFPVLTALGLPALAANITNTVALCPGYVGGALAQRRDLRGQSARLLMLLPAVAAGGALGAWLLLTSSERSFRQAVPFLLLLATLLLALQERVRALLARPHAAAADRAALAAALAGPAAIYGGYFGAGLGVVLLAVLGLCLLDTLTRLNALKQVLSLAINGTAALVLVFSGKVDWTVMPVMAVGALLGGVLGGRLASRVSATALRRVIVVLGLGVSAAYLLG